MTNDEILIVQYPFRMTKDRQMILHRNILEQKATGVILLPDYCKVITKPKDIDIQVELEEGHTCGECKWFSADYFHRDFECTNKIVPNGDDVCSSKWPACKFFELGGS